MLLLQIKTEPTDMSNDKLKIAKETIINEANALIGLGDSLNESFIEVVEVCFQMKGRLIVTGIGKSAIIGQKIVATLNSTGTPSIFMHAADAIHGDLGIISKEDYVLCISKSGSTPEIKVLVPLVKNLGKGLIAMVSDLHSYLATHADYVLHTPMLKEADPNNLAPTTSTTLQVAMGDALAVTLLSMRGFTSQDFAQYHPGGALGKKLYMRVSDLVSKDHKPQVSSKDTLRKIVIEISQNRLGATAVVDGDELLGVITDGDMRRSFEKEIDVLSLSARDIMTLHPKTIDEDDLAVNALDLMRQYSITQLLVVKEGKYVGFIHLHDLLKEGII